MFFDTHSNKLARLLHLHCSNERKKAIDFRYQCNTKTRSQKFSNSIYLAIFLKCLIYTQFGFLLSNLYHANLAWMYSICYIPNYYMPICVLYLYLVPLLLHSICNLLAYVVVFFVTSVCRIITVRGRAGRA